MEANQCTTGDRYFELLISGRHAASAPITLCMSPAESKPESTKQQSPLFAWCRFGRLQMSEVLFLVHHRASIQLDTFLISDSYLLHLHSSSNRDQKRNITTHLSFCTLNMFYFNED